MDLNKNMEMKKTKKKKYGIKKKNKN